MRLNFGGVVYGFERDQFGAGYWYCVSGHIPGMFSKDSSNHIVPVMFGHELTTEAVRIGLGTQEAFNTQLEKKAKEKEPTEPRKRKGPSPLKLKGTINPFAKFFSATREEPNLDELDLEDLEVEELESEIID